MIECPVPCVMHPASYVLYTVSCVLLCPPVSSCVLKCPPFSSCPFVSVSVISCPSVSSSVLLCTRFFLYPTVTSCVLSSLFLLIPRSSLVSGCVMLLCYSLPCLFMLSSDVMLGDAGHAMPSWDRTCLSVMVQEMLVLMGMFCVWKKF